MPAPVQYECWGSYRQHYICLYAPSILPACLSVRVRVRVQSQDAAYEERAQAHAAEVAELRASLSALVQQHEALQQAAARISQHSAQQQQMLMASDGGSLPMSPVHRMPSSAGGGGAAWQLSQLERLRQEHQAELAMLERQHKYVTGALP